MNLKEKVKDVRWMTVLVIIALVLVAMYAFTEINYFSAKDHSEAGVAMPAITIPSINLQEKINNQSIDNGVYHENASYAPTKGEVILFGHRTLQGSAFMNLGNLKTGDTVVLDWPGIGEVNYTISSNKTVPATYQMPIHNNTQKLYLISANEIGFNNQRVIYTADMSSQGPINNTPTMENTHQYYALIIACAFLIGGLILSFLYPKDKHTDNPKFNKKIVLAVVLILAIILFYFYFCPVSSSIMANLTNSLNNLIHLG